MTDPQYEAFNKFCSAVVEFTVLILKQCFDGFNHSKLGGSSHPSFATNRVSKSVNHVWCMNADLLKL